MGKQAETTNANITNRMKEIEDRNSNIEDTIWEIGSLVKENIKSYKFCTQNIQEIRDTMKRPNLRITGLEEGDKLQLKAQKIYSTKLQKKNFSIKKDMSMKVKEAYRTQNRLDQNEKKSPC